MLLGLIIILKIDTVKYDFTKPFIESAPKPVMVEVPFTAAIANKIFHIQFLPRAAFFDRRSRGGHSNTTVVLAHMSKALPKRCSVKACKIGDHFVKSLEVKSLQINRWLHKRFPEYTHDDVLIFCYDVPIPTVNELNNSVVSVVYVNSKNRSEHLAVESEHTLFIPNESDSQSSTVMTCTTVFDTPPHFGAWIRYQKTLGVDMVHINAHESFLSSSSFNDSFLLESMQNGFIQLTVWKEYLPPGSSFYHSQALYYQHCLYRYLGVHDYCVCADTDDFLVSIDDKDFGVHKLVKKLFRHRFLRFPAGVCALEWIRYVEPVDGFDPPEGSISSGNLTQFVDTSVGERERGQRTKSIYKPSAMLEFGIHASAEFMPCQHFQKRFPPWSEGYMAHIKTHRQVEDK